MQREEIAVAISSIPIRLIQRPPQVAPDAVPDAAGRPAAGRAPDAVRVGDTEEPTEARTVDPTPGPTAGPGAGRGTSPPPQRPRPHPHPQQPATPHECSRSSALPATPLEPVVTAALSLQPSACLLGWELWPAAWNLAAYLAQGRGAEIVRHSTAVLELGAGLGLPGIVAAKVGARNVTLTDLPQALPLLAANVKLNGAQGVCRTAVLDWAELAAAATAGAGVGAEAEMETEAEAASQEGRSRKTHSSRGDGVSSAAGESVASGVAGPATAAVHVGAYDVVLAADVVYVSSMAPLLADTIAAVVSSRSPAVVLVGHTVRKSVWLDRATGEVREDATDEPWERFHARMTQLHGFTCTTACGGGMRDARGGSGRSAGGAGGGSDGSCGGAGGGGGGGGGDADVSCLAGGGAGQRLPPDTFVCVFERPAPAHAGAGSE